MSRTKLRVFNKWLVVAASLLLAASLASADIVINDEKASRKHAEIGLYGPEAYVLRDLASTNGTWVNGRPVSEKIKLADGSLIRVGDTQIRFSCIEGSIPIQPL